MLNNVVRNNPELVSEVCNYNEQIFNARIVDVTYEGCFQPDEDPADYLSVK